MFRTIVTSLCSLLIISLFNGCCPKCPPPEVIKVPQKCEFPHVSEPIIDNTKYSTPDEIASKVLINYVSMKMYAEELLKAQNVCR